MRAIQLVAAGWVASMAVLALIGVDGMPDVVVDGSTGSAIAMRTVLALSSLVFVWVIVQLTRKRTPVDFAHRLGTIASSRTEVVVLGVYVAVAMVVGHQLGYGLHPRGALYGPIETVTRADFLGWAGFNFVAYAAIPYAWIRSRGHTNRSLGLRSDNLRADVKLIAIVLAIELVQELAVFTGILEMNVTQLALGMPLTFVIHLVGTGLPIMVCIQAILVPRFMHLTGSMASATVLGGLTYSAFHVNEYWTVFDSGRLTVMSLILVFAQFTGPGLIKAVLTLRTGNAWVHVWAYHSVVPHVSVDTPVVVDAFDIR